jgi:hypothetical protein
MRPALQARVGTRSTAVPVAGSSQRGLAQLLVSIFIYFLYMMAILQNNPRQDLFY